MENQPRHYVNENVKIDEENLPEELKGRLSVESIEEIPPGEVPDHLKPNCEGKKFDRLRVLCDNGTKVEVDYLYYLSTLTFKRQDGSLWYLCHTWTRTWGEDSKSGSTFINLSNGERHDVNSLSFWRGTLKISPDGNMVLIDAGISASSARKILIYDISALPKVETIHYEEFWGDVGYSVSFNESNEYVCTYIYGEDDDNYNENVLRELKVTRKRDIIRTVVHDQKCEYETKIDEFLNTYVGISKMIEIERTQNRRIFKHIRRYI